MNEKRIYGTPASHGIGEGAAFLLSKSTDFDHIQRREISDVEREVYRIETAIAAAEKEIEGFLKGKTGLSDQESAILEVQLLLLLDQSFIDKILANAGEGYSAEFSLKSVVDEYISHFNSLEDAYLRERKKDIRNIGRRILQQLIHPEKPDRYHFTEATIIVAEEMPPLELEKINQANLAGIVLTGSGVTSHEAVLSRSLEIPMVVGAVDAPNIIEHGDALIIDGNSGLVLINPSRDSHNEYTRHKEDQNFVFQKLVEKKDDNAVSFDGKGFRVGAAIGSPPEAKLAHSYGADHIGLLRTEFTFSGYWEFPGEEEQTDRYTEIVESMEGKPVTIRTFDAGGDKIASFIEQQNEANPYLGQRAVRRALEFEYDFRVQIRAILRSSAHGPVKLLIPLVTTVTEIKSVLKIIDEEKANLKERGEPYDPELPVGIMLEVPSALFILPKILPYIDFISIGMNDLTQYILAADRNNPKISYLYSPIDPSVLIAVQQAIQTCRTASTPVSICGEAVGHPEYLRFLLAMEPDEVNVYPHAIPIIKESIRFSSIEREDALLAKALACEDAREVETLIKNITEM